MYSACQNEQFHAVVLFFVVSFNNLTRYCLFIRQHISESTVVKVNRKTKWFYLVPFFPYCFQYLFPFSIAVGVWAGFTFFLPLFLYILPVLRWLEVVACDDYLVVVCVSDGVKRVVVIVAVSVKSVNKSKRS